MISTHHTEDTYRDAQPLFSGVQILRLDPSSPIQASATVNLKASHSLRTYIHTHTHDTDCGHAVVVREASVDATEQRVKALTHLSNNVRACDQYTCACLRLCVMRTLVRVRMWGARTRWRVLDDVQHHCCPQNPQILNQKPHITPPSQGTWRVCGCAFSSLLFRMCGT